MEAMLEGLIPISAIFVLFLFLPWLVFYYVSRIRQSKQLDEESQELFEVAVQRVEMMEDRMHTLERILDSEVPDWRSRS